MKHKTFGQSVLGLALMSCLGIARLAVAQDDLLAAERRIMDSLAQSYGATNWSAVEDRMRSNPSDDGNANLAVIPISLANVFLQRYATEGGADDLDRTIRYLESAADEYPLWGRRWLTPAVAQYFALTTLRLRAYETGAEHDRIFALWRRAQEILEVEADSKLNADLPYRDHRSDGGDEYDSSTSGNTRAEENAWEAALLAGAANFLSDRPHAEAWDRKARELAYDAITTPSDGPDSSGIKTTTVPPNFQLANHGYFPNPYYMGATMFLLCQGALSYRLSGHPVPDEFGHNVVALFTTYRSLVDSELRWTVTSDPDGDATFFPLPYDPDFERQIVLQKEAAGFLAVPVREVTWIGWGDDLWAAVQNAKVVMYYLMGSYLWHVPPLILDGPQLPADNQNRVTPELALPRAVPILVPSSRPSAD